MNIMVFDVPAESGGALSILNDFYNEVVESKEKHVNWFFVLSTPKLEETDNIRVLQFPWIKKSWGHRFYFDQVIAPKLVKKYKVDKVLSFQNITIPRIKCEQILYVHQPLPFVDYKFSIKDNKKFWIYQNLIGRNIISSIKKAKHVIVQTQWMKKACIEKARIEENKIEVIPPTINVEIKKYFEPNEKALKTFFYPASESAYKNHRIIVEACQQLKKLTNTDYEVILTLNGNENRDIVDLYKKIQNEKLPIRFEGLKTRGEVFEAYAKSILLFPSYIETFGMPLLEVRMCQGVILAADTPFAKEILEGYENAGFFDAFNSRELSVLMYQYLQEQRKYKNSSEVQQKNNKTKPLIEILLNS